MKLFDAADMSFINEDVVIKTPTIKDGFLYVPQVPGLGVELHETVVEKMLTPGKKPILVEKPFKEYARSRKMNF
ncbi:MAG: hypothetical protein QF888_09180 [Desulfobacterales bacterium]|jgi:L-alanine-DL-glutamate epimerase-like enolase superfamily enzyme|nr:hypothetical protein [Desulfobacterales bacterium]